MNPAWVHSLANVKRVLYGQKVKCIFCKTVSRVKACAVSRFDLDFWEWVVEIEWYTYWKATYFVMAAMFLKVTSYCSGVSMHIYN